MRYHSTWVAWLAALLLQFPTNAFALDSDFAVRTVMSGLKEPFEITLAPDGKIWFTERVAGNVGRVDPVTGVSTNLLSLEHKLIAKPGGAGDLVGLAIYPRLLEVTPYVYIV